MGFVASTTPQGQVFWRMSACFNRTKCCCSPSPCAEITNQAYNCLMNYTNRGGGSTEAALELAGIFVVACGTSSAVAIFLGRSVSRWKSRRWAQSMAGRVFTRVFAPYMAVTSAGTLNLCISRRQELTHGLEVHSPSGRVLGASKQAGRDAVAQTAVSRLFLPLPGLVGPTLCEVMLNRCVVVLQRRSSLEVIIPNAVSLACVWAQMGAACCCFSGCRHWSAVRRHGHHANFHPSVVSGAIPCHHPHTGGITGAPYRRSSRKGGFCARFDGCVLLPRNVGSATSGCVTHRQYFFIQSSCGFRIRS